MLVGVELLETVCFPFQSRELEYPYISNTQRVDHHKYNDLKNISIWKLCYFSLSFSLICCKTSDIKNG